MDHCVLSLDQYIIGNIGKRDYNIELSRYLPSFYKYEEEMLKKQQREARARQ